MSVFDQFDQSFLPGDTVRRKVKLDVLEYENFSENEEIFEKPQKNFIPFYLAITVVFFVLAGRLLNLQISQGSFNRLLAEGNRLREREVPAPRGVIYDRNGEILVASDAAFSLVIYPLDLPKSQDERMDFYKKLSDVSQIPVEEVESKVKEKGLNRADPIVLKENIDREAALILEMRTVKLPGVVVLKKPIRSYKIGKGLSQTIGYTGKVTEAELKNDPTLKTSEEIGKDGLEKFYNKELRGKAGLNKIEVDSRGRAQRQLSNTPPEPGNNLALTIDAGLQKTIEESLEQSLKAHWSKAGAAVAIDPKTGGILAMASLPGYDNNIFSKGASADEYQAILKEEMRPMFNRAVVGNYHSGSTIKPMVAAAALEEKIITENTTITDPGEIKVGTWAYPDWKNHGLVDVRKAIAESCNVFFYAVGGGWDKIKGLGPSKLKSYLERFGFGSPPGIDLPSEQKGLIPDSEWKEKVKKESWYLGDTYHMAIGQGDVLATPLQVANATAAIANGGEVLKPYLVSKISDKDGKVVLENHKTVIRSGIIGAYNLQVVREGMRQAVTTGSAKALSDLPVAAAAKTGTAQFGGEGKTHAWEIAFAPYDDPRIAIAVLVEGGGEGYAAAGPVVKAAFREYFSR